MCGRCLSDIYAEIHRLSDVCKSLHSNFDAARKAFAKWYMEPFGSAAMDDLEKQRLYFPMEAHSSLGCQRGTSFDPIRNASNGQRKRRRTSYRISVATDTLPVSESLSLANTPNSMVDTPGQTTVNEEVISSSTSESSELPRKVIHWHVLLTLPGSQEDSEYRDTSHTTSLQQAAREQQLSPSNAEQQTGYSPSQTQLESSKSC